MLRIARSAIVAELSILEICTAFYAVAFFVAFPDVMLSMAKKLSIFLCLAIILTLILSAGLFKALNIGDQILNMEEYKFWSTINLVTLFAFCICFSIKAGVSHWERGSDIYMGASSPVIINILTGLAINFAYYINK